MVRFGFLALVLGITAFAVFPRYPSPANPPLLDDTSFQNSLAIQKAMEQARHFLLKADAKNAVAVLEDHLPRVNGNPAYLRLLRDAYRTYIKDLLLANERDLAKRYLDRLCILDPTAAQDSTLSGNGQAEKKKESKGWAAWNLLTRPLPEFYPKKHASADKNEADPKPTVVRAKVEEQKDDPFDLAFQRPAKAVPVSAAPAGKVNAAEILQQAEAEFARHQFAQAGVLYEKVFLTDPELVDKSKDRWAYCMLSSVVEHLNRPDLGGLSAVELQKKVHGAMAMAPALAATANDLLREIDLRKKQGPAPTQPGPPGTGAPTTAAAVQHLGKNAQGWQVAETTHFRIHHHQPRELVDKIARIAETTRLTMFRKWFGADGAAWQPKCDLFLFNDAQEYTRATGVPGESPGHSRLETDNGSGRIVSRRMFLRCDFPNMLETTLPHETTHVVLAGMFGGHAVPRWVDEGMAVLSEPAQKVQEHRRNLGRAAQEGTLFKVGELMQLQDYPQPRRIAAFYAQSVALVDYLTEQKGPTAFTTFVRDGLAGGFEPALKKHYGFSSFQDIHLRWTQAMSAEINRLASK